MLKFSHALIMRKNIDLTLKNKITVNKVCLLCEPSRFFTSFEYSCQFDLVILIENECAPKQEFARNQLKNNFGLNCCDAQHNTQIRNKESREQKINKNPGITGNSRKFLVNQH